MKAKRTTLNNIPCILLIMVVQLVAAPAQAQSESGLVQNIDGVTLAAILEEAGAKGVESRVRHGADIVTFKWKGTRGMAQVQDDGLTFRMTAGWAGVHAGVGKMNEWNSSHRFVTAFLDEEGDPVLVLDVDVTGGVTRQRVDDAVSTFFIGLPAFEAFLGEDAAPTGVNNDKAAPTVENACENTGSSRIGPI